MATREQSETARPVGGPGGRAAELPSWVDRIAYPFSTRSVRLPSGNDMHYVDEGEGDPILFVHGTPSWSFEWRHVIRTLATTHRCLAPDLLGFGLSARPRSFSYTPEAHANELEAFVEALDLRHITLVVHDFGGPIGLPLALDRSGIVRRLVVLNSWMWNLADDPAMARVAGLMGGRFGKFLYEHLNLSPRVIMPGAYADKSKLTPQIHAQYLAPFADRWSRGAVLWTLARALLASGPHYEQLWSRRDRLQPIPVLVIWGTRDPAFKVSALARWREAVPHAKVVELPVGHWPQEEAPDHVGRAIAEFLGQAPAAA
jgi:pimeloyl-ACP methyl ester carboxylesterase